MGYVNPIGAVLNGPALNRRSHAGTIPIGLISTFLVEGSLSEVNVVLVPVEDHRNTPFSIQDTPSENTIKQNTGYICQWIAKVKNVPI